MFKLVLEKAEEPEIKLPTSVGSWKKQESSRKTSTFAFWGGTIPGWQELGKMRNDQGEEMQIQRPNNWLDSTDNLAAVAAKLLQSCPTLCDPIDSSPPGFTVPRILQARTLEWVAISFSNAWKWKVKVKSLSRVRLLATPWTAAHQAPPSMGFSRQEYQSGVPLLSPDNLAKFS